MKVVCQLEVEDAVVKISHDEHHNKYWWTFSFTDKSGREMNCESTLAKAKDAAVTCYRVGLAIKRENFRAKWRKL